MKAGWVERDTLMHVALHGVRRPPVIVDLAVHGARVARWHRIVAVEIGHRPRSKGVTAVPGCAAVMARRRHRSGKVGALMMARGGQVRGGSRHGAREVGGSREATAPGAICATGPGGDGHVGCRWQEAGDDTTAIWM